MTRFKDCNIPAYRTVLHTPKWQSNAVIYATLGCLILLGAQSFNIFAGIITNPDLTGDPVGDDVMVVKEGMIWIEDMILGDTYKTPSGQSYRYVTVKINNTIDYYSPALNLEIRSFFAGDEYDSVNHTLANPENDIALVTVKIHDTDDTSIASYLNLNDGSGVRRLDSKLRPSLDDIYITEATGKVVQNKPFFSKSVEINVMVYNDGSARSPKTVSIIVTNQDLQVYRGSVENNATIRSDDFWEATFKFDVLDGTSVFEVKLNINEENKEETIDKAVVLSG